MIRKLLTSAVGVLFTSVAIWVLFLANAPTSQADLLPTNSSVFSGRFIPAFIGSAYDPSTAYEEMAGLPVYVIAFDFWNDSANSTNWIVSDLAVKTQIRSDGTFQVQGLPHSDYFGVYFPFALDASSGQTVRTDCSPTRDLHNRVKETNTNIQNPCDMQFDHKRYSFRMPRPEDNLQDVFSYAPLYLTDEAGVDLPTGTGAQTVDSQIQVAPDQYEQIRVEHVFVTNRLDLDIENNINTFPIVPSTTLKVNFVGGGSQTKGSRFNVYALRVSQHIVNAPYESMTIINSPAVVGRGTKVIESSDGTQYSFASYAPPGVYAVTIWREEDISPTYSGWDGEAPLNTHLSGWALVEVFDNHGTGRAGWRDSLQWSETVRLEENQIIVWGTVTTDIERGPLQPALQGFLLTPHNYGSSLPSAEVLITSDTLGQLGYRYAGLNDSTVSQRLVSIGDVHDVETNPSIGVRGIYAIASPYIDQGGIFQALDTSSINDRLTVYLNTDTLATYSSSAKGVNVSSVNGPTRFDLEVANSESGQAGGYDTGFFVKGNFDAKPASGARVTFWCVMESEDVRCADREIHVPGENKVYYLDRRGELHIPRADLVPPDDPDNNGFRYVVLVTLPNAVAFQGVTFGGDYFERVDVDLQEVVVNRTEIFNLAFMNKIVDFFNDRGRNITAYAQSAGGESMLVPLSLKVPTDKGVVNGIVGINIFLAGSDEICAECEVLDSVGNPYDGDPSVENLQLKLWLPNNTSELIDECNNGTFVGCEDMTDLAAVDQTYTITAQVEIDGKDLMVDQNVSVGTAGVDPSTATLDLSQSCGALQLDVEKQNTAIEIDLKIAEPFTLPTTTGLVMGMVAKGSCEAGQFFGKHMPGVLGMIYKYGLQTRALTQDQPIILLFDVVRNITNLLFVVAFVLVGFMTIVQYQPEKWHLRVLLPKLITGLVLSNFSLLIVQALLDLNNFATFTIFQFTLGIINQQLSAAGNAAAGANITAALSAAIISIISSLLSTIVAVVATGGFGLIPIAIGIVAAGLMLFVQVMMLLFTFFSRYLIIWIGVIAAPLIFGLGVLPWFAGLQDKWWKTMISITSVQTVVAGVISVGVLMLTISGADYSFFTGFGKFIIALIALSGAVKIANKQISNSLGSVGMGVASGAAIGAMGAAAAGMVSGGAGKLAGFRKNMIKENRKTEGEIRARALEKGNNPTMAVLGNKALRFGANVATLGAASPIAYGMRKVGQGVKQGVQEYRSDIKSGEDAYLEKKEAPFKRAARDREIMARGKGFYSKSQVETLFEMYNTKGIENIEIKDIRGKGTGESIGELRHGFKDFADFLQMIADRRDTKSKDNVPIGAQQVNGMITQFAKDMKGLGNVILKDKKTDDNRGQEQQNNDDVKKANS